MNSIIKAVQLDHEPIVLTRIKRRDETSAPPAERRIDEPAARAIAASAEAPAACASAADRVTAQEPPVTYDAYKERFAEELQALEQQARQAGFARGLAEGREQAAAEYAGELEALANLVGSARAALDRTIDGLAEIGVEIAFEAVCKIIGRAMAERDVAVAVVREVIRRAKDRTQLVVRVSPADLPIMEECRARLLDGINAGAVEIVADEGVQLGGCLLDTPTGSLDGRLEIQLERLREVLLRARPQVLAETEAAA